ncbi:MAG: 50S ribosomal protein L11 methyltransferase [Ilumatobacteraceae bacterium]
MRAFVVTVPASESELAADVLWSLGAAAIEERDALTDSTLVELVTVLGDDELALTASAESFPTRWRWHVAELDESVMDSWRAHAVPSWVASDLVVVPSWTSFDTEARPGLTVVRIDPGAAFGLGDHPTTIASLRAMRAVQWPGASVLDIGCGSGVLGIVAALGGAPSVVAVDISQAAIEATADNAKRNHVDAVLDARRTPAAELDGPFDIVVANILAPVLISLAPDLRRLTAPGGVLVVSGLLRRRDDHVLAALEPMHLVERHDTQGWTALTLRH